MSRARDIRAISRAWDMPFGTGNPTIKNFQYNILNDMSVVPLICLLVLITLVSVSPDTTMYASPIVSTL